MKNKIIREILIIILLLIIIIFSMWILFYDSFSENVEDIISVKYETSDNIKEVIEQINFDENQSLENSTSDSLLKSYSMNEEDLSAYASEKSYESGKKDPFSENSEKID